jgi:hypothetical protein
VALWAIQGCLNACSVLLLVLQVHESATSSEHEQRILLETIVSLLPSEKNAVPCSFLFSLLRTAIILDTTVACRLDLETRIGMQLEQATLDDLLIPSFSYTGDTLFDVDIVQRIAVNFLQQDEGDDLQVSSPQTSKYWNLNGQLTIGTVQF